MPHDATKCGVLFAGAISGHVAFYDFALPFFDDASVLKVDVLFSVAPVQHNLDYYLMCNGGNFDQ